MSQTHLIRLCPEFADGKGNKGESLCSVWIWNESTVCSVLTRQYTSYEMRTLVSSFPFYLSVYVLFKSMFLCEILTLLNVIKGNCESIADEYIECEAMVNCPLLHYYYCILLCFLSIHLIMQLLRLRTIRFQVVDCTNRFDTAQAPGLQTFALQRT